MGRPRQVSDEDILAIARRCFLEQGPSVSTVTIAEQVGLSQAALFKRFGTKQDLMFQALLPPALPDWIAAVERGVDERPLEVQLRDLAGQMMDFFNDYIPRISTLKAANVDVGEVFKRYEVPPPMRARAGFIRWLREAEERGLIRPIDHASMAEALIGGLQGHVFLSHIIGRATDDDAFLESWLDLVLRGLLPGESA